MALILPSGPSFAHWSDNLGPMNINGAIGYGAVVAAGTSNADGADTAIMSALTHDCEYLQIIPTGLGNASQATAALMDLLVDPAGGTSWSTLITDLMVGASALSNFNSSNVVGVTFAYHFPLWIPAGASLGARIRRQSANAADARIMVRAAGGNRNPASWWCGQKVESIGINASTSNGQLHTPGAGATISGAADNGSGLIRITTSATNPFVTGDVVTINGVNGTVEANGTWTITVISTTTFDLQGSTFVNAYSAGSAYANGRFSSWADLGSPITARTGAVQWRAGGINTGTQMATATYDFRFGAGGAQIGPRAYFGCNSGEHINEPLQGPVFCDIPAGTQLQVRGSCSLALNGNQTNMDVAAYCVQ